MRMITGFIPPTEGAVSVGGFDVVDQPLQAKRLIGYLPESAPAYSEMSVRGFLSFIAELRGLRGGAKKSAVDRAIEMCFLGSVAHQTVETLSTAAISYYALGLIGYGLRALPRLDHDLAMAAAAPLVVIGTWLAMRRIRARLS